jgi:hypothetical protein
MPFDEDASELQMTTTNQDHASRRRGRTDTRGNPPEIEPPREHS